MLDSVLHRLPTRRHPMDTKNLIERARELGRNLRFWKFCLDCGATINRCKAASDAGHIQCCPDCNHSRHEVIPALTDALEKSMQDNEEYKECFSGDRATIKYYKSELQSLREREEKYRKALRELRTQVKAEILMKNHWNTHTGQMLDILEQALGEDKAVKE